MLITTTADGSSTVYSEQFDEHYHSSKGALAESDHVFIQSGYCKAKSEVKKVFEVGLGTGLNAILTYQKAVELNWPTYYVAIEAYPLSFNTIKQTEYCNYFKDAHNVLKIIHEAEWNTDICINKLFTFRKIMTDFTKFNFDINGDTQIFFDVIYFDAFSPEKQPEMWSSDVFQKVFRSMSENGVLTTYCAKGSIRRMLNAIGFVTQRISGPVNGKREMLRAIKPSF